MYPEKRIYDIAGYPAVKGRDLVEALARQASSAQPHYLLGRQAQHISTDTGGSHTVTTDTGEIRCRAIVITAGIGTFTPRKLVVGNAFLGRGLEYFVPDPSPYQGADVVIVGGGDSALDWALMLDEVASSVTVVHRRKEFRAHRATVEQVTRTAVEVITDAEISALGGNGAVEHADIAIKGRDDIRRVPCQRVVAALGFVANVGPLREWGIELRNNRHIVVDSAMHTTRTGVFAAGDIVDYEGKVRLISVGFGEVATAVNNAAVHINPNLLLFPGHSTDEQPALTSV